MLVARVSEPDSLRANKLERSTSRLSAGQTRQVGQLDLAQAAMSWIALSSEQGTIADVGVLVAGAYDECVVQARDSAFGPPLEVCTDFD
jgi:hypothetical protein